jgi:hypothetical protein
MSNCEWVSVDQLSVVGAESEATLILIFFKEVLLHLMNPIDGIGLEPEQLGQVFSAAAVQLRPWRLKCLLTRASVFLFNCPAARAHRSNTATEQLGRRVAA